VLYQKPRRLSRHRQEKISMADKESPLLDVYLREYDRLKSEQLARIGFRDNLIYVTIVVISGILTLAFRDPPNYTALLVIPWATLILGWTYLVNDEKISATGKYIRLTLAEKIQALLGEVQIEALMGWEIAHRSDKRRGRRKLEQLLIDEITFILSGLVGLGLYWQLTPAPPTVAQIAMIVEALLLIVLGAEIVIYSDRSKGR
jgi:hypothetical protein